MFARNWLPGMMPSTHLSKIIGKISGPSTSSKPRGRPRPRSLATMRSTRQASTRGMFAGCTPFFTLPVFLRVFFPMFVSILAMSWGEACRAKRVAHHTGSQASSGLISCFVSGARTSSRASELSASILCGSLRVTLSSATEKSRGRLSTVRRTYSDEGGGWKWEQICRKVAVSLSTVRRKSAISSAVGSLLCGRSGTWSPYGSMDGIVRVLP
mmetsp:Transcript_91463/g.259024  ORF Transcript_91463/g.259024 Transcript_91463/m.259024 type:complete len:212 (+) Transcript_91463:958-1593(+)